MICFHYVFMDKIEINFLTQDFKLLVCFWYIDDVFLIWTHGKKKLEEFLTDFNNYHPDIKLTHEFNKNSIPFLDLKVSLSGGQLSTDLHKCTDKYQYLPYLLIQTIANVPLFLVKLRRVSRICYNKIDFERHLYNTKTWFQARSYPKHLTQNVMSKIWFNKENSNTKQTK